MSTLDNDNTVRNMYSSQRHKDSKVATSAGPTIYRPIVFALTFYFLYVSMKTRSHKVI